MNFFIKKAKIIVKEAHDGIGQLRKGSNQPYFIHLERVALSLSALFGVKASSPLYSHIIAASYLHAILEDTPISVAFLRENFSD